MVYLQVVYDAANARIGFAFMDCDTLSELRTLTRLFFLSSGCLIDSGALISAPDYSA